MAGDLTAEDSPPPLTHQKLRCLVRPGVERVDEPLTICDDLLKVIRSEPRASFEACASTQEQFATRNRYLLAVISYCYLKGVFDSGDIERRLGHDPAMGEVFGDDLPTAREIKSLRRTYRFTILRLIHLSLLSFEERFGEMTGPLSSATASPPGAGEYKMKAEHLLDMASIMDQLSADS